jgi:hypothetical protein
MLKAGTAKLFAFATARRSLPLMSTAGFSLFSMVRVVGGRQLLTDPEVSPPMK